MLLALILYPKVPTVEGKNTWAKGKKKMEENDERERQKEAQVRSKKIYKNFILLRKNDHYF